MILAGESIDNSLMKLCLIYHLLNRTWSVRIRHVPRTQNEVANHLIKYFATGFTKLHLFAERPLSMRGLVLADYNVSMMF